ncbi:MAG: hypothetical protein KDA46_04345 [Parvularculaceae bacterium]|nr:hypothetical protein [Parvularculaceae bacterium]
MKLPVFKALGATFGYLISRAVHLVQALWLPGLLMIAAMAWIMPDYIDATLAVERMGDTPDPAEAMNALGAMMAPMGLLLLASAIFYPMMIAASLRNVVRGDELKMPFYLNYGGDEIRIALAYILLIVLVSLAAGVGALALGVLAAALAAAFSGAGAAIAGVIGLVAFAALIWFMLRLSVMFAASIGTRTLGLAQSWSATKGAVFSLFAFWLVIVGILMIIGGVYFAVSMPEMFGFYGELMKAGADQAAQSEISARMMEYQKSLYTFGGPKFFVYTIATYVYLIVQTAIWGAASGVAWRYLSDDGSGA